MNTPPRIAVVGAGAAGLMSAWLLQEDNDVVVFEAADRPGGHIYTVMVEVGEHTIPVELGAEFFFEHGYSGLVSLIKRFQIPRKTESLAVSMTLKGRTIQVPPRTGPALWRCLSPATIRRLYWLRAFGAAAEELVDNKDWSVSVQRLIEQANVPSDVATDLIIPLIASSWGVPRALAAELSAYSVVQVMGLRLRHPPHGITVEGGLRTYTDALIADAPRMALRLGTPAQSIVPVEDGVMVHTAAGPERFDAVILACDWHNSATLCARSSHLTHWHRAFSSFEDYSAHVAVHRELSFMPRNRSLWGRSNFTFPPDEEPRTTVWSGFSTKHDVFRTWLGDGESPPPSTTHTARYRHIAITPAHHQRQRRLAELQGTNSVWAVGMYTDGVDNHESALRSALRVCERLTPHAERVQWFAPKVSG
ncbi:MAG: putative NAD/FAD-binding protein [Myxococcota bacterium]|jgi:predicted NAD/FAD-binding protein